MRPEPVLLGLLGAVWGSFAGALAVRWPEGRSVARGRSACDACGRTLRAWELVPLLSGAALRWRCRTCGAPIDPVQPILEAGGVLVGVSAGLVADGWRAGAGAAFGWLLLALAALDWRALWLPDRLVAPLALGGLAAGLAGLEPSTPDRLLGGAAGFGSLWAIAAAYRRLRGRDGMGGGDPKLFGAVGLWLGWRMLPAVLTVAALLGLGWALFAAWRGRGVAADTELPLGALIAAAAYPAWALMLGATP